MICREKYNMLIILQDSDYDATGWRMDSDQAANGIKKVSSNVSSVDEELFLNELTSDLKV